MSSDLKSPSKVEINQASKKAILPKMDSRKKNLINTPN